MAVLSRRAFMPNREWLRSLRRDATLVRGASEFIPGEGNRRLLVFIHGWCEIRPVSVTLQRLREDMPGWDFYAPRWYSPLISNANPERVARAIRAGIQEHADKGAYEEILLVGYSCGAVLLKRAYLLALGIDPENALAPRQVRDSWTAKVKRVVMLAGVDRGWKVPDSVDERPSGMSVGNYWFAWLFERVTRPLPIGRFIRALYRGEPFIADLRIAWLRYFPKYDVELVQVLGDVDEVVAKQDAVDIFRDGKFVLLGSVPDSSHYSLLNFVDPVRGKPRLRIIHAALTQPFNALRGMPGAMVEPEREFKSSYRRGGAVAKRADVHDFIFLVHGIRANADWCDRLAEVIKARRPDVVCLRNSYGYFSMLRFLLAAERMFNVRWFADQYTEALARFPQARFHFVGHSNGTFVLAKALRRYPSLAVDRVAFAGSVMTTKYDWPGLGDRVGPVRNYCGAKDIVVGIFPYLYEKLGSVLPFAFFRDLGGAGFVGFAQRRDGHCEIHYVNGGHSGAIGEAVFEDAANFIIGENRDNAPPVAAYSGALTEAKNLVSDPPWWATMASRLNWLIVLALLAVAVAAGYGLWWLAAVPWGWGEPAQAGVLLGYGILVYLLLNTI